MSYINGSQVTLRQRFRWGQVTSVVGAAVVSFVFFSLFPHAASINADRSVIEPNKILFFTMLNLLKWLTYKYFIIF